MNINPAESLLTIPFQKSTDFVSSFEEWLVSVMKMAQSDKPADTCLELDWNDIQATLQGDDTAFARLIQRYERAIASRMWRFTRERVEHEELVQDVFVEAFQSLSSYKGQAPFIHWLNRIASRLGYRFWKKKTQRQSRFTILNEDIPAPEKANPSEAAEFVDALLKTLPVKERTILTLHYLEDLSLKEIANEMGWSYTNVKIRAYRARQALKRSLIQAGYGDPSDA